MLVLNWKRIKSVKTQRLQSINKNIEDQQNQNIENNIASTSQQVSKFSSLNSLLSKWKNQWYAEIIRY